MPTVTTLWQHTIEIVMLFDITVNLLLQHLAQIKRRKDVMRKFEKRFTEIESKIN